MTVKTAPGLFAVGATGKRCQMWEHLINGIKEMRRENKKVWFFFKRRNPGPGCNDLYI